MLAGGSPSVRDWRYHSHKRLPWRPAIQKWYTHLYISTTNHVPRPSCCQCWWFDFVYWNQMFVVHVAAGMCNCISEMNVNVKIDQLRVCMVWGGICAYLRATCETEVTMFVSIIMHLVQSSLPKITFRVQIYRCRSYKLHFIFSCFTAEWSVAVVMDDCSRLMIKDAFDVLMLVLRTRLYGQVHNAFRLRADQLCVRKKPAVYNTRPQLCRLPCAPGLPRDGEEQQNDQPNGNGTCHALAK